MIAAKIDGVFVDRITEKVVQLGPQFVALQAWNELATSPVLEKAGLNASQVVAAQFLVANRLIASLSEWLFFDWSGRMALPEILNLRVAKSAKDRLSQPAEERVGFEPRQVTFSEPRGGGVSAHEPQNRA